MFRHIGFLIGTMVVYLFESIIIGFFIFLAWKYVLYELFPIVITYFQWVFIVWIIKMLFYDILKTNPNINYNQTNEINESHDKNNNIDDINKLNFN